MKWRWLWVLLPLLIGGVIGTIFASGLLPNPVLYARADLTVLVQFCGLGVSLILAGWFLVLEWSRRQQETVTHQLEEQAAADRRRFLQRLDHELKNPLTAIQAGLVNLGENPDLDALGSVKAQTLRLSRLVSDLRKLADLETRPIEHVPVNIGEILETVVELAREGPASSERRISLTLPQAPWPLPPVLGDGDLLLLAVHNLLDNALKFTSPGDTVEVRASEDGTNVVIEVADTGPGIPEGELPFIWEELYRGEGARGVPGSGLGLPLVRAVVERHGGSINLRSRTGQGTVVSLRLPSSA
jgi:two-component system OmpR family sensor kinase